MSELIKLCFTHPRHTLILFGHWLLHAYGIISLTRMESPTFHASLIALIPFPAIFYILTVSFTDPNNLDSVSWVQMRWFCDLNESEAWRFWFVIVCDLDSEIRDSSHDLLCISLIPRCSYTHAHTHTCICTHTHAYAWIHTHTHVHTHMHTPIHVHMHAHTHTHAHTLCSLFHDEHDMWFENIRYNSHVDYWV